MEGAVVTVISALMKSLYTEKPLFGFVVSDDDFAVIPLPPSTDEDVEYIVNDYTHRFEDVPAEAAKRFTSALYNTPYEVDLYTETPDGDLQQAVADLTQKIAKEVPDA